MRSSNSSHSSDKSDIFILIRGGTILDICAYLERGYPLDVKTDNGVTPLMAACGAGKADIVRKFIIEGKVKVNEKDNNGRNCLHHLCIGKNENRDIFHLISPIHLVNVKDNDGKTPLQHAIDLQLHKLVEWIVDIDKNAPVHLLYNLKCKTITKPSNANRYGFVYDPSKEDSEQFIVEEYSKKKLKQIEERKTKWKAMIKLLEKDVYHKKFVMRLYKGMPDEFRPIVWRHLLLNDSQIRENYESLQVEYKQLNTIGVQVGDDNQIHKDVKRTMNFHYTYEQEYSGNRRVLFNIIHCYLRKNNNIEYMQGMTDVPSLFALQMNEFDTYLAFSQLFTEKYRYGEMYTGFSLINKCWLVQFKLLEKYNPRVARKLLELDVPIDGLRLPYFMLQWHYTWFIECFRIDLVYRVFDAIILEGFPALFSVANALFHFIEEYIVSAKDGNMLQQGMKRPFKLIANPPSTDEFMKYVEKHKILREEVDELFALV